MATSPHNVRFTPRKRTLAPHKSMSAKGRQATYAVPQVAPLFDHLVRNGEHLCWHLDAECPGSLEVGDQLKLGRLDDG